MLFGGIIYLSFTLLALSLNALANFVLASAAAFLSDWYGLEYAVKRLSDYPVSRTLRQLFEEAERNLRRRRQPRVVRRGSVRGAPFASCCLHGWPRQAPRRRHRNL